MCFDRAGGTSANTIKTKPGASIIPRTNIGARAPRKNMCQYWFAQTPIGLSRLAFAVDEVCTIHTQENIVCFTESYRSYPSPTKRSATLTIECVCVFHLSPPSRVSAVPPGCSHAAEDVGLSPVLGDATGRLGHLDDGACDRPGQEVHGDGYGEQGAGGNDGGRDDDLPKAGARREGGGGECFLLST